MCKENSCMFTGHRPERLYGYDLGDKKYQVLAQTLLKKLRYLVKEQNVRKFYSGGALGLDMVAFFTVEKLKKEYSDLNILNILVVPYEEQSSNWNDQDKERYHRIKKMADEIVYVDTIKEYQVKGDTPIGLFSKIKLQKRNEYMVDQTNYAIAVWDGKKQGGTYNCIEYLLSKNRHEFMIAMHPFNFGVHYLSDFDL